MRAKSKSVELHGPSVGIGAGVTALVIVAAFFALDAASRPEIELQPAQIPEQPRPTPESIPLSVFIENGSPLLGNPNATVTLVEFGDYQCHFCNVFYHSTEWEILEKYVETGKVNMIFKDLHIIGPDSINASHGAHCANDQDMFWQYHDALYDNWDGEETGWASSEHLLRFATDIGLDTDLWSECMLEKTHQSIIASSNNDARTLGLNSTPAFFVLGSDNRATQIRGAQSFDVFAEIFDAELAK